MFVSSNYTALAALSSLVIFIFSYYNYKYIQKNRKFFDTALNVFDSIGLGVFVVLGKMCIRDRNCYMQNKSVRFEKRVGLRF